MKVRAIKRGFCGGLYRRPGDVFDCSSDAFSSNWMEKATKDMKPLKKDPYEPLEIPSLLNKPKKATAKKAVTKKATAKKAKAPKKAKAKASKSK